MHSPRGYHQLRYRLLVAVTIVTVLSTPIVGGVSASSLTDETALNESDVASTETLQNGTDERPGEPLQQGSTSLSSSAPASGSTIHERFEIDRTPEDVGRVNVTYEVSVPEGVVWIMPYIGWSAEAPVQVHSTDGFTYDESWGYYVMEKSVSATETGSITYTVATNGSQWETLETSDWAYIASPQLRSNMRYSYYGGSPSIDTTYETVGEGYGGGDRVFLGPHEVYEESSSGQSFDVVVPDDASPGLDGPATAALLGSVADNFDIGDRDSEVAMFYLPEPVRAGGRGGGSGFWVGASTYRPTTTVVHEYVHTRQAWLDGDIYPSTLTNEVDWLTEASADYYAGYLAWQDGQMTNESYQAYLDRDTDSYADEVLLDQNEDSTEQKNYYKGRRVLGALDIRIHQHTDGEQALETVLRRVNTADQEEITYSDFRGEVVAVTNESTGEWLDTHVETSASPDIPADVWAAYHPDTGSDEEPEPTPELSVSSVAVSPSTVSAGGTTDQTVTATVSDLSDDSAADAVTVALPGNASVADADAVDVSVVDANGTTVQVVDGPWVVAGDGGTPERIAFDVAPGTDVDTTAIEVTVDVPIAYPAVDGPRSHDVGVGVADSARGTANGSASVTVVTGEGQHGSGVSHEVFGAVAGDDGTLSASDFRSAVRQYVQNDGVVGGVSVEATDIRTLVAYYIGA